MLGSHACRQCKTRLTSRAVPLRAPQWQPRATFISLRNALQPDAAAAAAAAKPKPADNDARPQTRQPQPSREQDVPANNDNGLKIRYHGAGEQQGSNQPRRQGRYSRHLRDDAEQSNTSSKPSLIRYQGAGPEQSGKRTAPTARRPNERSTEQTPSYTKPIFESLNKHDIETAWDLFQKTYTSKDCEALTNNPSLLDMSRLASGKLPLVTLQMVNKTFCASTEKPVVTPTEVLFRLEQLDMGRAEFWHKTTMVYLTHQVVLASNGSAPEGQRDLPSLLRELISVWRLFFQCMGPNQGALESISTEWNLPTSEYLQNHMHEDRDFNFRMQTYHPKCIGTPALGFCAAYLFSISDALSADEALKKEAEPLFTFLAHLLAGSRVNSVFKHVEVSNLFNSLPEKMRKDIVAELNNIPQKAWDKIASNQGAESGKGDTTSDLESFHIKKIARAVQSRPSSAVLDNIWKQVERSYTPTGGTADIPPRLYNAFLSGYMVLFQSHRCVEVWNHMIAHGIQPDEQTWVALLKGCEKGRDLDGFNATWQRMLSTGVEPDSYMWTTRIHGLMSLRQISAAFQALDDMANTWLAAEKAVQNASSPSIRKHANQSSVSSKRVNKTAKPSIEVINGAITAIVQISVTAMPQKKRIEMINRILVWAKNFEIKPNAITYNTLIQLYLRAGDVVTAFNVLSQMEKEGVAADIATHAMIIKAMFDNQTLDDLSHSEQAERLVDRFNQLEEGGLRLNEYVYSTAIDRLLKQYSNHEAVRILIEHMQARNLIPSAYIYTSLVSHYFAQDPPAIEAVDAIMFQIFNGPRIPTDKYLFERTIQGYAAAGEVGKMMSVLTRMSKHGNLPGWRALEAIIHALVKAGDIDRARFIVRDCERSEGVAMGGITGGMALQKKFFYEATKLGIGPEQNQGEESLAEENFSEEDSMRSGEAVAEEQNQTQDFRGFLDSEPGRPA